MKRYFVGNLKMHLLTLRERDRYVREMRHTLRMLNTRSVDIVLCPPYVHLEVFARQFEKYASLGVQDVSWERKGALTGEISAPMVHALGATYTIVGHSERRHLLGETDEMIARKAYQACVEGMRIILCVGETREARDSGRCEEIVRGQIEANLQEFPKDRVQSLLLAYEPVWAIGTGRTPSIEDVSEMRECIAETLGNILGQSAAREVPILYGGSVSSKNVRTMCVDSGMNGVLVGGASLHVDEVSRIVQDLATV